MGVKIYTVAAGREGLAPVPVGRGLYGLRYENLPVRIDDPRCVAKTFPDYFETLFSVCCTPAEQIPVICIDGPTASGKGTLAAELATRLGLVDHALPAGEDLVGQVLDLTGGQGCQTSLDASGAASARVAALAAAADPACASAGKDEESDAGAVSSPRSASAGRC